MAVIKYRDKQGKLQLVNIPISQVVALPEANQNLIGKILQYTGETTKDYTNGYFYKCISSSNEQGTIYLWSRVNVQPAGGGTGGTSNYEDLENLPRINGVIIKGNKTLEELGINNFNGDYNNLINIPDSFTPSKHSHMVKDITDLDLTLYVEKQQGTENTGKILKVNEEGNLVLTEESAGNSVSVSAQGTSTDSVRYITVDGTEYLIGGSAESSLSELTDVNLTNIANGQILSYNSETNKWKNIDAPSGTVIANPTGESSEDLTKIQVGNTIYGISSSLQINTKDEITNLAETIKSNDITYGFKPTYKYNPVGLEDINKIKYIRATFWASAESNGIEVGEIRFSTTADDSGENFAFTGASVECSVSCYNDAPASNIITNNGRMGCNSTNPIVTITLSDLYLLDFTKYSYIKIYRGRDSVSTTRKLVAFSIDYSLDGEHYYSLCPQTNCDVDNLVSYGLAYTFDGTTLLNYSYSSDLYSKIVLYDNTTSNLEAENVQKAIDKLAEKSISIIANPNEEIVKDLTKIKIDGTTYRIADDSIGKKVWYRFTTQSAGGNDASLNVTCDGVTKNYLYSTIRSTPLVIDGVFKLNYGLNGNQWRVTCLGDKIFYNNSLMKINAIIKEWSYGETVDFEIYNFTGTINEIIPNPENEGVEDLTKISINGTVYNVSNSGSGSSILPNPEDISTEAVELTSLRIDNNDYKITSGSNIIPNPSEDASNTLNKITIGDIVYSIAGGVLVEANPQEEALNSLSKIKIGDTVYTIVGGEGGSSTADGIAYNPSLTHFEATNVQDAIDEMYTKIPEEVGTIVVGNPPSASTEDLTKIKIDGITYNIPSNIKEIREVTQDEYDVLEPETDVLYCIKDGVSSAAESVEYDNTTSGLSATTMQAAIDEMTSILKNIIPIESSGETF